MSVANGSDKGAGTSAGPKKQEDDKDCQELLQRVSESMNIMTEEDQRKFLSSHPCNDMRKAQMEVALAAEGDFFRFALTCIRNNAWKELLGYTVHALPLLHAVRGPSRKSKILSCSSTSRTTITGISRLKLLAIPLSRV